MPRGIWSAEAWFGGWEERGRTQVFLIRMCARGGGGEVGRGLVKVDGTSFGNC